MEVYTVFVVIAFTYNMVLALNLRQKRQDSIDDNVLDNRYDSWGGRPNPDGDRWIWESQEEGINQADQWQQPSQVFNVIQALSGTLRPPSNGRTAQQECIRNCPVTTEYNPVCGTDLVQYSNIGRLECSRSCGVNLTLLRAGRCPPTTTASPTS
ncbi:hypothetical protein NE865_11036 [Phthorimaea operculella]|nr:hypothetical protein NE865_11036 [Phthorimaea operculella]